MDALRIITTLRVRLKGILKTHEFT